MADSPAPRSAGVTTVVPVDAGGLSRVGARPGLLRYLTSLWSYRSFVLFDSRSRVAGATSSNVLGRIWMVLNPLLDGSAYFLIFGLLFGTGRGVPNFIAYLMVGVFLFRYTSQAITNGAKAISGNLTLVRAFRFPRATLVFATNIRELLLFVPSLVVMLLLVVAIPPLEAITWRWLLVVPLLAVQTLFNIGLSLVLARIVARWVDVANLISFGTRLWLYLSAVFFSADRFASHPAMVVAMHVNPMYCVLDIARQYLLYGADADPMRWIVLGAWTVGILAVGMWVFWSAEESYGEEQ